MQLKEFVESLQKLIEAGHGELEVFYSHGSSGDCGNLSSAHVTDRVTDCGPFDLEEGEKYISVYAGN